MAKLKRAVGGPDAVMRSDPERARTALAAFFDVSLDLLCIRDRDLRFVKVNKRWEAVLGHPVEALEGRPMLDFIHPDDTRPSRQTMEQVDAHAEVVGFVNRYRHADGGYRHLEWTARQVGDLVYGVARDVTERIALQAELEAAREAAEAANRAKSDFLANMSHEIRTPLNGVIGVAGALGRTHLSPHQREMVTLIESSGATLERIVSDVLDFSKIEAGELTIEHAAFDLGFELSGVVEMFRLRADEKGLTFDARVGGGADGRFLGDCVRIKQVLANLLSNAIKFTQTGGVAVRVDVGDDEHGDSTLLMYVEDTGVGFEANSAKTLFQRFRQADGTITRRFGGSGLGLSIVRELVGMMDGRVEATSKPGVGSLFRVEIPLLRDTAPEPPPMPVSVELGFERLDGLRVLLADDHPVNRRVVELILEPLGVRLTMVENGQSAVEAFGAAPYDLVLMDMQMPVLDGLAATRAIRAAERGAARR